jgi:hypothetical protein
MKIVVIGGTGLIGSKVGHCDLARARPCRSFLADDHRNLASQYLDADVVKAGVAHP